MDNKEIQALLLKYRQGNCTEEEAGQIHRWYESLNANADLFLGSEEERDFLESKIFSNIQGRINEIDSEFVDYQINSKRRKLSFAYSGVAALLILGLSFLLYFNKSREDKSLKTEEILVQAKPGDVLTTENETSKNQKITLQDRSVVTLAPGSRIICPRKFAADKREVQLVGDAFFEVTKNPAKPFCVYSGKLITRVLGTSFRIKTNQGSGVVEVEVLTGKVSVFENSMVVSKGNLQSGSNGVVLTPNQKATYYEESGHLMTGLVDKPVPDLAFDPAVKKMIFSNEPITKIFSQLQNEYGIEIVLGNEKLEKCTFTGDISDMLLYDRLELICKSNQASYEIKGTRILISGDGCE